MDLLLGKAPKPTTPRIIVWRWRDAPEEFREMSTNGGDEDWVAMVPRELADDLEMGFIGWMEEGSRFGPFCVDDYLLPDGSVVRIGSHS